MSTIFVSVASFRDYYCSRTLESIYENAANPEKIYVGICIQNDEADEDCVVLKPALEKYKPNIATIRMRHFEAKGPTWARYLCTTLYNKQDYFLQIDSHTLFAKDWDAKLINMILEIKATTVSDDVILSQYPPGYEEYGLENTNSKVVSTLCTSFFNDRDMISFPGAGSVDMTGKSGYIEVAYIAGGMFFCEGKCIKDVPYDPNLPYLFVGEEISHSIRCWTSGYDIYTPNENVVYHLYGRADQPHVWDNNKSYNDNDATNKIKMLLQLDPDAHTTVPEYVKLNIEKYGLGTKRTLQQYYDFTGIDIKNKTVSKNFCDKWLESHETKQTEGFSSFIGDSTDYLGIFLFMILGISILNIVYYSNKIFIHKVWKRVTKIIWN